MNNNQNKRSKESLKTSPPKIVQWWYRRRLVLPLLPLLPLSLLFTLMAWLRRLLFFVRIKKTHQFPVPVIIVGNVTVGGTGKTPLVLALVEALQAQGYRPGIVSRGYGGQGPFPQAVDSDSKPSAVGDKPLMLAQLTDVPVAVAPKRPQAVELLLNEHDVDLIIADDGLQHYALGRQIEIAVVDGERGLGNGWRLPAGPLRESKRRLRKVDWVVVNGAQLDDLDDYARRLGLRKHPQKLVAMQLQQTGWRRVSDNKEIDVPDGESALAIAGIGNPERFFNLLKAQHIDIQETRVYPDHYQYRSQDFYNVSNEVPVLMTEKDAVKCRSFARPHWYFLQVKARFSDDFLDQLSARVQPLSAAEAKAEAELQAESRMAQE